MALIDLAKVYVTCKVAWSAVGSGECSQHRTWSATLPMMS